ncbi:MAG: hypothetical protein P1V18_02265 [Candidatus Gracilibacteria bacterium]|nr:hypothetical protein [Candidatus Gracilibacteria bacterium]
MPEYRDRKFSQLGCEIGNSQKRITPDEVSHFLDSSEKEVLLEQYGVLKLHVTSDFSEQTQQDPWRIIKNTRDASLNGLLHTDGVDFALYNNGGRSSSTAILGRTKGLELYSKSLLTLGKRTRVNFSYIRDSIQELLEKKEEYKYASIREDDEVYQLLVYGVLFAISDRLNDARRDTWFEVMNEFTKQMRSLNLLLEENWLDRPILLLISKYVLHYRLPDSKLGPYEENHTYRMNLD